MEMQNSHLTPRPTVPPKPKPGAKPDSGPQLAPGIRSTVGTQVNLLRKFSSGTRPESSPVSRLSPNGNEFESSRISSPGDRLSSAGSGSKPALPPKPSPNCFSPPRRPSATPPSKFNKSPEELNPKKSSTAPHASIEELDNLSDLNSPPTPLKESHHPLFSTRSAGSVSRGPSSHQFFQYPIPVFPFTPSQRLEAQRKSASLGRNINSFLPILTKKSTTLSRVLPLDLSPSNPSSRTSSNINSRMSGGFRSQLSFTPSPGTQDPPSPPPRARRKPLSPLSSDLPSPTLPSPQSAPVNTSPPVYAVVDKEKKWGERRLKLERENNNGLESTSQATSPTTEISPNNNEETALPVSSPADASFPESWLGRFIEKTVVEVETPESAENASSFLHKTPDSGAAEDSKTDEITVTVSEEAKRLSVNESFLFHHVVVLSETTDEVEVVQPSIDNHPEIEGLVETPTDSQERKSDDSVLAQTEEPTLALNNAPDSEKTKEQVVDLLAKDEKNVHAFDGVSFAQLPPCRGDNSLDDEERIKTRTLSQLEAEDGFENLLENRLEEAVNPALVLGGVTTTFSSTDETENRRSSPSDADLVYQIIRSQEQFKAPLRRADTGDKAVEGTVDVLSAEAVDSSTTPMSTLSEPCATGVKAKESFRRRSWTCSEISSSFSESSPSSSSSNSLRDRTSSVSGSLTFHSAWVDEGEISTGALGDTENSDAAPCAEGSTENVPSGSNNGSFSRRRRIVNSIFSSFGKLGSGEGSSSSGSSLLHGPPPPRRKEKSKSNFFIESASVNVKSPPGKTKKVRSEVILTTRLLSKEARSEGGKAQSLPQVTSAADESTTDTPGKQEDAEVASSSATLEDPSSAESSLSSRYDEILADLTPTQKTAFYVAREILTSERTFVDVLNLLTVEFPAALKAAWEAAPTGHPIILKADLDMILGGLPILKGVNQCLLNDLEDRVASWKTNPKVSDIFVKTGPFLKHYSTYIRDFHKISQHFDLCRHKNLKFSRVVSEFEQLPRCKNLQVRHFMLKPVQRMPQYALLLGSYLKNLAPDSEDYEDTIRAIRIVREVAEHGNEAIRLQKNAEKLVQLQSRLTQNVILKADRQLVYEGELLKVCRKELQPRYFALMSDCLLCMYYGGAGGSAGTKEFKLRYELPLAGMRVTLASSEDYQNEFSVISITRSFNLVAKSAKEREDWMKALDVAIRNNIKKRTCSTPEMEKEFQIGKVAPVWIADSRVTMCQACTAEFKITFRRHHCRACGKVVCGNCSGSEAPLQYQNFEATRVCNDCYEYLLEEFDKENHENSQEDVEVIRSRFKKGTPNISKKAAKHKKSIPPRLEVHANSSGSAMSGYLQWKEHRKAWKKQWFVLIDQVLYVCAASEDIAATKSIPILGYQVEFLSAEPPLEGDEGKTSFQLTHSGQDPYIFQAENSSSAEKWMTAMREATVLK